MSEAPKEKQLSAAEICKIIDSCKKAGVVELKFRELSLNFNPNYNLETPASTTGFEFSAGQIDKPQRKELDEDTLDELMLSNPAAYEEALNARLDG